MDNTLKRFTLPYIYSFSLFCYNDPMVITYYGAGFVRLSFGDMVIAVNPTSKDYPGKTSRFGADIAMVSLNDQVCNGASEMAYGNKDPFVVSGPGEYEFSGVFIKGYDSVGTTGRINTIY